MSAGKTFRHIVTWIARISCTPAVNRAPALSAVLLSAVLLSATPAAAQDQAGSQHISHIRIFMYHRFGESEYPSTSVRLDQFEAHLAELKNGGYKVIPLPEAVEALRNNSPLPENAVAITIDDAYLSVYEQAWPRLRKAGFPFTLFVSTDPVDRGFKGMMNWDQIRELAAAGVTIANHSASHPHMPLLGDERRRSEIARANARFIKELGKAPKLFAYPYGEYGLAEKRAVRDAGFIAAFGQQSGVAFAGHDMYALPRFALNENYAGIARFRTLLKARPLPVKDVTPEETVLRDQNPPLFGFTLIQDLPRINALRCYPSNSAQPARIQRLGKRRFEIRLDKPFPPGRSRINCTMPTRDGRWRWFGRQFYIPENQAAKPAR